MKNIKHYFSILLFGICAFMVTACEEQTARGPGNGGTGPFIVITASHETISARYNSYVIDLIDKSNIITDITVIKKSDDILCSGFKRNIEFDSYTPSPNKDGMVNVVIKTSVTNTLNKNLIEIQKNCQSYEVKGAQESTESSVNCESDSKKLVFLPQQTHNYKLTINDMLPGVYNINYINVPTPTDNNTECKTYLQLQIK